MTSPLIGAKRIEQRGSAEVAEVIKAGSYTYLRLSTAAPGEWHVVMGEAPALGKKVQYRGYAEIHQFHSKALNRVFEHLIFTSTTTQEDTQ